MHKESLYGKEQKRFGSAARVGLVALVACLAAPSQMQAAGPEASHVCLNVRDIQRTEVPNDRTIVFRMRDGAVWRNTLKTVCPMLKISPFTEVLTNDMICANQQIIHVALTGNSCVLGDFTPGIS